MKILITGPQGSGKTTQARALADFLKVPLVGTGEVMRERAGEKTEEARMVKKALDEGKLVDDEIVANFVKERVSRSDCQSGFVMDGYPRSLLQIDLFDPKFDQVFYLDVPDEMVVERLLKRSRADDTLALITERLKLYHQLTQPIIGHFQKKGILKKVDGTSSIDQIQERIRKWLSQDQKVS